MLHVVLKLRDIPEHSQVTMKTGTKIYWVKSEMRYYTVDRAVVTVPCENGCRFLESADGVFRAYDGSTEVVWLTSLEALNQLDAEGKLKY